MPHAKGIKDYATDQIKTTLTERCLYAKPFVRGLYCTYQGPCAFRGAWIILYGKEQQKCNKVPLQFADWNTVGLYVWPSGTVTIDKMHDARREICTMIAAGKQAIVVDLTNVTELHVNIQETLSDLRGELLKAHNNGTMIIINLDPMLQFPFESSPFAEGMKLVA